MFGKARSTIKEHVLSILEEGELKEEQSVRKIGMPDFFTNLTNYYSWMCFFPLANV